MSVISELIKERNIPDIFTFADGRKVTAENFEERRKEMLKILTDEEYGTVPPAPEKVDCKVVWEGKSSYAGKAYERELELSFECEKGRFAFPVTEVVPKKRSEKDGKCPVFVLINFRPDVPDKYLPAEEIVDSGCAVVRMYYNDIGLDAKVDETMNLATKFSDKYTWGKLSMWAWAASRVMDYVTTTDYADLSRVAVTGHSRLGKTSLLAAARDERFFLACANDSGCSGDAITRGKKGEHIVHITKSFPYWFCPAYLKYVDNEDAMPFDQHFLVACIAPRKVALGASLEDEWACPDSQYLSACEAGKVWEMLGLSGFVHPDRLPEPGDVFHEGNVGYHLRYGAHFYSREDWQRYIECIKA